MTAQIISVGTELLLGDILNTNAQFLSRELAALGISVLQQHTVGDNHGRLEELVEETFEGSMPAFIAAFSKSSKLTKMEVDQLRALIDRFQEDGV